MTTCIQNDAQTFAIAVHNQIRRHVVKEFKINHVSAFGSSKLQDDLGLDSMDRAEVFAYLEKFYGIQLNTDIKQDITVDQLVDKVVAACSAKNAKTA